MAFRSRRGDSGLGGVLLILLLLGAAYYFYAYNPATSLVSMDFVLTYADGSTKTITVPSSFTVGAVTDTSGKVISSIGYTVRVKPTWTGTATKIAVSGETSMSVVTTSTTWKAADDITYSATSGLVSGSTYTVQTGSISAATLEGWSISTGSKTLRFDVTMSAVLTMSTGATSQKTANAIADIGYVVAPDGLTVLTATITTTVV